MNNQGRICTQKTMVMFASSYTGQNHQKESEGQQMLVFSMPRKLLNQLCGKHYNCVGVEYRSRTCQPCLCALSLTFFCFDQFCLCTLCCRLKVSKVPPAYLRHFDFIISPEYTHCTLLGVTKTLLCMWTDTSWSRNTLHPDIPLLDERLSQISVPSEVWRKPCGISDMKGNLTWN